MVVIGAGVMGSATARVLAERGLDTVLLEQFPLGHARGSSHGPSRIFRLSYPDPDYVRLAERALPLWRQLEAAAGEELLVTTGGLDVGPVAAECGAALEACGTRHEWLSPEEAVARFPAISFEGLGPVLFQPDAGVSLADRTVAAQVRLARAAGCEVLEEEGALRLKESTEGVEVSTGGGTVSARVAVATVGSWAGGLLGEAGFDLAVQPILQQVTYFAPRQTAVPGAEPAIPTFIEWGSPDLIWYAVPPAGDAPGLKLGEHVGGVPVDPAMGPFPVDPSRADGHSAYVRRRFPGLAPEPVASETCLYTMTPDEHFVLDRRDNLVIGAGFSGHGFKFGPLIGEVLADLAMGIDPRLPGRKFALDRPEVRPPAVVEPGPASEGV